MFLEIAAGCYLVGSYAYHRWFEDPPPKPKPARVIDIPRTDDGARVPLIYGRCLVKSPWLAWVSTPDARDDGGGEFTYLLNMFFVAGIGFGDDANNRLRRVFVDGKRIGFGSQDFAGPGGAGITLTGDGNFETPGEALGDISLGPGTGQFGGLVEFLNGRPDQVVCDPNTPFAARTFTGLRMLDEITSGATIPSYRGYLSVFLHTNTAEGINGRTGWQLGNSPKLGAIAFEVHSYPVVGYLGPGPTITGTDEANPADVLANVLTGTRGKGNVAVVKLDLTSFEVAAATLDAEGIGYSRSIEDDATPGDVVDEIMRLTDGLIYENPTTGKWVYKLVRADYDPNAVPLITTDNCSSLTKYAAGSRSNVVNKVRVTWTDRDRAYQDSSATAQNQANAVSLVGTPNEVVLRYPACCSQSTAEVIAGRELSARSRPLAKLRAIVDRTFVRVNPGDVVAIRWSKYNIDGLLFRVAAVERGTREDANISLDLVQEYFNVFRDVISPLHPLVGFPFGGVIG